VRAEPSFQYVRLGHVAWEPIEQESIATVRSADSIFEKCYDEIIGNEIAPIHVLLCFLAQRRLLTHGRAEKITGRNVRHTEAFSYELRLCALPRSWGA
jgi:hypothetical protein